MSDQQAQAQERNEAMEKRRHDLYLSRVCYQHKKPVNGMHEKCPSHAVKVSSGVYDCGGSIFVGDRL